jgi:hypothetical protein
MRIDESALDAPRAVTYRQGGLTLTVVFLVMFVAGVAAGVKALVDAAPAGLGVGILVTSGVWLVLAWLAAAFTRIEVDQARRTLDVFVVRWPWASRRGSFALDKVRDAIVHRHGRTKGAPTYSLQLVVEGLEGRVTILECRSFDSGPIDHVAGRVQAMLGRGGDTKGSWE